MSNAPSLMTSGQAADLLGIPSRTMRRYLHTGRLRATQHPITGRWLVSQEDLMAFLREHRLEMAELPRVREVPAAGTVRSSSSRPSPGTAAGPDAR
jgi:excisionase family DNA binding protein